MLILRWLIEQLTPVSTRMFDDHWSPAGNVDRYELRKEGLITESKDEKHSETKWIRLTAKAEVYLRQGK